MRENDKYLQEKGGKLAGKCDLKVHAVENDSIYLMGSEKKEKTKFDGRVENEKKMHAKLRRNIEKWLF